jgi:hypothetical protein
MKKSTELSLPGPRPDFKWIPLKDLSVDHTYQRTTQHPRSQKNLEHLVDNFTWAHCGVLVVGQDKTKSRYYVIDGQHRLEAASKRGDIDALPCFIIKDVGTQDQAQSFVAINRHRVGLHTISAFHARAVAGDETASQTIGFLLACGITVPKTPVQELKLAPNELQCVGTISSLLRGHTKEQVKWALDTIAAAYPDKNGRLREMIIKMLSNFIRVNANADRDIAVKVLRELNPRIFEDDARNASKMQGGKTLFVMVNAFSKLYAKAGGKCQEMALPKMHGSIKPVVSPRQPQQRTKEAQTVVKLPSSIPEEVRSRIISLKKKGKTLGQVQLELKANSNSERKAISDIYYGSAA